VERRCLQTDQTLMPKLNGRIVLSSEKENETSYLLDLQSGNKIDLGHTKDEVVSPDGSKLAYYDIDLGTIVVADADGKKLKESLNLEKQLTPAHWLDNQRLMINKDLNGLYQFLDSLVILNPLTGEQQEWLPDYPQQDSKRFYYWKVRSTLIPNPALTHLIYPIYEDGNTIALWNIQSKREVARIYGSDMVNTPWWSPDGTQFVTAALPMFTYGNKTYTNIDDGMPYIDGSELFLVSITGEIRRLTYFSIREAARQNGYTWSPDGKQIAFWELNPLGDKTTHNWIPELVIVGVETGDVTNYCRMAALTTTRFGFIIWPPPPVWSLDNRYLVVNQVDEELHYKVFLVDLQTAHAWQIAENVSAYGWMGEP